MSGTGGDAASIVDFDSLGPAEQKLILEAVEARKQSYSPHSNFAVGACLQCEDGTLFRGCNVENAVYGLTICAERTAVVKAVSEGNRKFKCIAVIGDQENSFTTPCGQCRQYLSEFNADMKVYVTRSTLGKVLISTVAGLLPYRFI